MAMNDRRGYRSGLVDLRLGQIFALGIGILTGYALVAALFHALRQARPPELVESRVVERNVLGFRGQHRAQC